MLRDKNAHIIRLLARQKRILLTSLTGQTRIRNTLALVAGLHFSAQPRDELRATNIKFLLANKIAHFVASLFAVLLGDYDPAVVVFAVFGHQLFEGGGVYCEFGADAVRPEVFDDFDAHCAKDGGVETSYEDIALL